MSDEKLLREIHLRQDDFEKRLFRTEEMYRELKVQMEKIITILEPISETYKTVGTLRKWINAGAIGIVTLSSAFFGIREVIKVIKK